MDEFYIFDKVYGLEADGYELTIKDFCNNIERYLLFQIRKSIRRKYCSLFNYHLKYIKNYIHKPLKIGIIQYSEQVRWVRELTHYLPTSSNKCEHES